MTHLEQEEWQEQLQKDANAVVLDVRTPEEFEEGFIPNATNLDLYLGQEFVDEIQDLDKSKNYYVYCRSGKRSEQACVLMKRSGIENVYNLIGGILEWEGEVVE